MDKDSFLSSDILQVGTAHKNSIQEETLIGFKENKIRTLVAALLDKPESDIVKMTFPEIYGQIGFGKGRYHLWDVFDHTRKTIMNHIEFDELPENIRKYLESDIDGLSREVLLQLAMAFHDSGKKSRFLISGKSAGHAIHTMEFQFDGISARFNLTESQKIHVGNIIRYHDIPPESLKEMKEEFIKGGFYIEYLLISYADFFATMGKECTEKSLSERKCIIMDDLGKIRIDEIIGIPPSSLPVSCG